MTADDVQRAYYEAYNDQYAWYTSSGNPVQQAELHKAAWDKVLAYVRKDSEQEMERLRQENRRLTDENEAFKEAIARMAAADATYGS